MLTETEQQTVNENKIWGFGAYLQCTNFDMYYWGRATKSSQLLPKEKLQAMYEKMCEMKGLFDITYGAEEGELLMLKGERIAWLLLSENIQAFLDGFEVFLGQIDDHGQELMKKSRQLMNEYRALLHKWNIISLAYNAKYERNWIKVPQTQQKLQKLIDRLKVAVHDIVALQTHTPQK